LVMIYFVYLYRQKTEPMYKQLIPLGEKLIVNRVIENTKNSLSIPGSAKTGSKEMVTGMILHKGKGSSLNNLKDVHEGDMIAYPPSAPIPIPEELRQVLNIESANVEIVEYREIFGTI
jgi:co-chaperonin GroES (HSP10)